MELHRSLDFVPLSMHGWYTALDHRRIEAGHRTWITEVSGVHSDDTGWWIQMSPVADSEHGFVLHLPRLTSVRNALDALRRHSRGDSVPSVVVEVTRAA